MQLSKNSLIDIKKRIIKEQFAKMNDEQRDAIFQIQGPVLILAGAGSGKTTVLVNRIAYMLNYGNAYNDDAVTQNDDDIKFLQSYDGDVERFKKLVVTQQINPWNILAITFTNKAASELKDRLFAMLGETAKSINAGTFHSICVRILRREIEVLGYGKNFTIYDTDDSLRTIKDCLSELNLDDKTFAPKAMLGEIGRAKDSLMTPDEYLEENQADFRTNSIGNIYKLYQKKLRIANALDFDDIICKTVSLFMQCPDVLDHYQNLYKYVLVDEYQDTNHAQYKLVSLLSQKNQNLCVVGDDDQSIYKFRGATIENILSFEKEFKNAVVIRLEQNYRSTQVILDAANEVIKNNTARKGKNLWTENGDGEKITAYRSADETQESEFVAKHIQEGVAAGLKFNDHAILYRMNAQSATIERQLVRASIPYKIVGGRKFFDRKEIRDILAYLQIVNNPTDTGRLKRVINEPKRGIGETTVKNVEDIAERLGIPMLEVMKNATKYDIISKKSATLGKFAEMIECLQEMSKTMSLDALLDEVLTQTTYMDSLKLQGKDGVSRIENVNELKTTLIHFEQENSDATVGSFLEEVALYTDLDSVNSSDDNVILMTMHSAKGLEFKTVFIVGMEESIFPSFMSSSSSDELEEERRLAYVAITRAKEKLYFTNSAQRMLFGRSSRNMPSRFLKEVSDTLIEVIDDTVKSYGYTPRQPKPKAVYKPEVEGTVGVQVQPDTVTIDFAVGDTISHKIFGKGSVVALSKMSNDTLVEVSFDKVGTKKIMANFAKLEKL